jgi:hypothetical protein
MLMNSGSNTGLALPQASMPSCYAEARKTVFPGRLPMWVIWA